jgi:hypothetical protein
MMISVSVARTAHGMATQTAARKMANSSDFNPVAEAKGCAGDPWTMLGVRLCFCVACDANCSRVARHPGRTMTAHREPLQRHRVPPRHAGVTDQVPSVSRLEGTQCQHDEHKDCACCRCRDRYDDGFRGECDTCETVAQLTDFCCDTRGVESNESAATPPGRCPRACWSRCCRQAHSNGH